MARALPPFPGFCGPSYQSQSLIASVERSMNWYVERIEVPYGKARQVLYPTPGLLRLSTAAQSPTKALFAQNSRCFLAAGRKYYQVAAGTYALTELGTIAADQYPVTINTSGDAGSENFVTAGGTGYLHDLGTGTFTSVVSGATMGGLLDGYFLRFDIATSTLAISDLLDGTTWDPLQFVQRSSASDPWKAMLVRQPGIWLLGEETGDIYYNANAFPFPFRQIANVRIAEGIAAPFSLKDFSTGPIWLTYSSKGGGRVVQAQGYRPTRISNHAVEWAISQYRKNSRIDDAVAFVYEDLGHEFYELNFPTAGATWVYDGTTQQWHERGHWNVGQMRYEAWGPQYHTTFDGKHIVGDHRSGAIYEMSATQYADTDGDVLRRERITPALMDGMRLVRYPRFELLLEAGIGTADVTNPQIALSISRDGGRTFGPERLCSAGASGEFARRLIWTKNGAARQLALKVVATDKVPWRLINMFFQAA